MAGFLFTLETVDGLAADPPTLEAAVPNWRAGDSIFLANRTLRMVATRDDDADQAPVLVVEDAWRWDAIPSACCVRSAVVVER